jgi:uncharacterized protein DUF6894
MARFFFHVTNGSTFKDAEGENCPSLEAARTHAAKIAGELGKDRGYEGFAVSVTDEQGNEVAYVTIGEAAN